MSNIFQDNSTAIGNTPLVKLNRVIASENSDGSPSATVYAKIESRNPSFSVKDRIGASMVWEAEKEGLLLAPAYAVPKMLAKTGLSLQDFDYYEIHEAFAAQVLATLKAWEDDEFCRNRLGLDKNLGSIDRNKLNVNGSSIAAGHPFAATGARIVATLAKMLEEKGEGRGLISICAAGGQGVTAILERA